MNQHGERLSWGDSVFLNLERPGMPLNVRPDTLIP